MEVTHIGTWPPLKSNVYYCTALTGALRKKIKVNFISFNKLYPKFLYPDEVEEKGNWYELKEDENFKFVRLINYNNPLTWIKAGFRVKTKIVQIQWWSLPLAPILTFIMVILKLRKKKIVLSVHNVLPHGSNFIDKLMSKTIGKGLTKFAFSLCEKFFVHSQVNLENMHKVYGIPYSKLVEIPMGIHDMYIKEMPSKLEARKRLGLNKEDKVVLNFGNIKDYKGIDDLIIAFNSVNKKIKNCKLIIAGKNWEDFDKYQKLIDKYNLKDKVILDLRYVPTDFVENYFSAMDVLVLPYKYFDAQSGPGNIALSFFKPIIVTDVGGLRDLVLDKNVLVKASDTNALAESMIKVLTDKKLYGKLVGDSKVLAKKFSWDSVADKTIEVYQGL
ncbi:MAG: glycosyltransferase family 4 protein [Candidatus Nanoarchaeia archaeon]|nr:glycosyltransferase family 4 protein [Candidatus Nanoarchaeia archaeon]